MGGDLAKGINSRYGPSMPCGLLLGASVVLHYGMVRGIEERPFPGRGLSSQAVHPVARGAGRGRWQRVRPECR